MSSDPFDHDRHIDDDTEVVVSDGEEQVVYAEVRHGPWSVEYERGLPPGAYEHLHSRPASFKVKGPLIQGSGEARIEHGVEGGFNDMHDVLEQCGGWAYVELGAPRGSDA